MRTRNELRCCLGCGRDTRGVYCHRCGGPSEPVGKGKQYRDMPLEDDYSEESNADSVCDDDSALASRR